MRRLFAVAGALMVVAAFIPGSANAQLLGETMATANKQFDADPFTCTVLADCNLHVRMYGDVAPLEINGPAAPVDGFPSFATKRLRYDGDGQVTSNYPTAATKRCEAWYAVWDGATNPELPTYISYYGSQSQLINTAEGGLNQNQEDCTDNTGALACFGALGNTLSVGSTGSAQGPILPQGGMSAVPVPTVVTNGAGTGVATLSLDPVHPGNNINLPSKTGVPCEDALGTPFFFDDLTATTGPGTIYGVGLYAYAIPDGAALRNLLDLEGTTSLHQLLTNPSSGMACTDNSPTGDCPGVGFIACGSLVGASCVGDLLSPAGGSFDVPEAAVVAALPGLTTSSDVVVFLTKVHYRGSVPDSNANPNNFLSAGQPNISPSLVSLFSAASTRVSYSALAARVNFTRISPTGNRVVIDFETVGSSFAKFTIERANDGVTFQEVGTVTATGESNYSFTDTIRGRAPVSATYKIVAEDFDGNLTQVFKTVDLSGKPERGGPRR